MARWFRFYDAVVDDPKIGRLTDKQFRAWFDDFRQRAPRFQDRPPQGIWRIIRERIFKRDDYTCAYCGARGVALQCDHVVPVAKGGGHTDDNLVTACKPCNQSKADDTVEEWRSRA